MRSLTVFRNIGTGSFLRGSPGGLLALFLFALLLLWTAPVDARSRVKAVGYVDGYLHAQKAAAKDASLGYRSFVARARERLKRLKPYPRKYVKGFEEGARDFFRGRKMDHTKEGVDSGLRPEGALEALAAPD